MTRFLRKDCFTPRFNVNSPISEIEIKPIGIHKAQVRLRTKQAILGDATWQAELNVEVGRNSFEEVFPEQRLVRWLAIRWIAHARAQLNKARARGSTAELK